MNSSLQIDPILPMPVLVGACVLVAMLAVLLAMRGRAGTSLRILALCALLAALANPVLRQEERQNLSNIAVVVRDLSASQAIANRSDIRDALHAKTMAALGDIENLEVRTVDAGASQADGTAVFAPLEQALADIPSDRLAGVVILTDGQIHDVPETLSALAPGVPVHTILTGPEGEFDRRLRIVKAPRYGLVDSTGDVLVRVEAVGTPPPGVSPDVVISARDQEGLTTRVRARLGQTVSLPLRFPKAGPNILELSVPLTNGELTELNNKVVVRAEGVRENLRVLLVSGEPHAGERTWRNLLKSDAAVDLVHFTILRPPEKQDGTPINELSLIAFPTRELFSEKLEDFDLIIFDRYTRRGVLPLLYLDNIAQYVARKGGAVLLAAGSDFATYRSLYRTPLSAILPAEPTGRVVERAYRPALTSAGDRHPVTRSLQAAHDAAMRDAATGLSGGAAQSPSAGETVPPGAEAASGQPWGRWFRIIEANERPGSDRQQVLMRGPNELPLLVLDRQGEGRVAMLLSDHAWLWARGLDGGGPHRPLLRRLAHWLMKEPDLEEEALTARASGTTIFIERRTMGDAPGPVTLSKPDGTTQTVTLSDAGEGVRTATYESPLPGLHRLAADDLNAVVHAGQLNTREFADATTTAERVAPLAASTGGGTYWPVSSRDTPVADIDPPRMSMVRSGSVMSSDNWLALRDRDASLTTGVQLTPFAQGFAALAVLLALLALMWWREGRGRTPAQTG